MQKLNKKAIANSLAFTTGILYLILYILALVAPPIFNFIFDSQFLGANISSLISESQLSFGTFIITLIVVVITAWIAGYIWGALYNKFNK